MIIDIYCTNNCETSFNLLLPAIRDYGEIVAVTLKEIEMDSVYSYKSGTVKKDWTILTNIQLKEEKTESDRIFSCNYYPDRNFIFNLTKVGLLEEDVPDMTEVAITLNIEFNINTCIISVHCKPKNHLHLEAIMSCYDHFEISCKVAEVRFEVELKENENN